MKYATRILVSVIAVSKSQEFLLKVRRLFILFFVFILFFAAVFTSTRRIFFDDDTRGSTSTTSRFLTTSYTNQTQCHDSLGPCEPSSAHNPNGISISAAVFAQITAECSYTLQWDAPSSSPQNCPSHGRSGPPSNTWFPGPTRVLNPNGISIGSAVFARLTSVADRQTDRQTARYLVGNNRPHLHIRSTGDAVLTILDMV